MLTNTQSQFEVNTASYKNKVTELDEENQRLKNELNNEQKKLAYIYYDAE